MSHWLQIYDCRLVLLCKGSVPDSARVRESASRRTWESGGDRRVKVWQKEV
uniref:Uncharacterized protein n=1 Tax=Amphimedon queenslandica TaxID=400682 RepID=A0A1X7U4H8_AMPQE